MGRIVEFVFGLGSRYSYLASTQLDAIAERTGCSFAWTPVSSVTLMSARGNAPFLGRPVSGQYEWTYRQRDAEDWAHFYNVPYVEPSPPPEDHALMAVATRAAGEQGALVPYAKAMFRAMFVHRASIDERVCMAIAGELHLDLAGFGTTLRDPSIRARVDADARERALRGAFGVPSFFVDGRIFWGNDRLVLLEHWLTRNA